MGDSDESNQRPRSSEGVQFIAVVLIIAIGVAAFFAVLWMFNAMVNAKSVY